jgi:hypothetical protein
MHISPSICRLLIACGFRKREGEQDQEIVRPNSYAVVHADAEIRALVFDLLRASSVKA